MLEIVLTSSESDQYSSAPKEISKFPLMYMMGYFCRSVYIERTQGCEFMNLRTHAHIYIKLFVIKNFCTIKLGFICEYIALKQKFSLEYMFLL